MVRFERKVGEGTMRRRAERSRLAVLEGAAAAPDRDDGYD
jgi:hypothetical protein